MSKNTGTSELINYFDLGVNGDVGIAGSLDINTIANATTDTDTFLVSDTGIIKYRTGAQLLSDIGAAPAVAGGYVPYTGATTNVDLGVYNLTASAIIANGSGSNSGIVHLESNAIHSLVNGYGSIASGTTNQFNFYQTTGAGVFRGAILSLNSITEFATRTFTLPDSDGTIALTSQIPANPVGGTGTSGTIPVFTGSTTIGNSIIQSNATQVNVVGNGSQLLFDSLGQSKSGGIYYTNDFELLINNSRGVGSAIYLGNVNMDFHTNVSGNPRLRITSGGNILVGTTTDNGAKFQVNGSATITNSVGGTTASNYLQIEGSTANNSNYPGILFKGGTLATTYPKIELSNGGIALVLNQGFSASLPNTSQISLNNGAITLSTGSTLSPRLTVNEVGNVGIGTSSPNNRLQVNNTGGILDTLTDVISRFNATTNTSGQGAAIGLTAIATKETGVILGAEHTSGNNGDFVVKVYNGGATYPERMRITSGGNVLIGTTTDNGARLQVSGVSFGLSVTGSNGAIAGTGLSYINNSDDAFALVLNNNGLSNQNDRGVFEVRRQGNSIFRINNTGNVGIGTASPSANFILDINSTKASGASGMRLSTQSTSAGPIFVFNYTGSALTNWGIGAHQSTSGSLEFVSSNSAGGDPSTAGTSRMQITSSGNVLIGTTTDNGNKFQVSGNATISGSGNTLLVSSNNNSLSLGVGFQGVTSGYIGGISSALYGYSTNGGYVLLNSSSAWVPASDIKRKRNFEPYTKGLSAILGLQPKLYNMDFQKDGDEKQVGLVAQEVKDFIPLAYEDNAGFIGLNYNAIIVTMVKAIQEQQQQIQELKNKLS